MHMESVILNEISLIIVSIIVFFIIIYALFYLCYLIAISYCDFCFIEEKTTVK